MGAELSQLSSIQVMTVSAEVLEELKCHKCESYLSRSPVYLQHDGAAVCDRCFAPERPATRNFQYETLARLLRFPCKNRNFGCTETVTFAEEKEDIAHEDICEYRQYMCPVLGSLRCDWSGTRDDMLTHCQQLHLDRVLENPCNIVHDITSSSQHNYLISAFQLLFLVHTKISITSGKIFHSVRLLGTSEKKAEDFYYVIKIKRNNELLAKEGNVASQDCLSFQEDSALALNINSLLDVLGGWDGASFTLTIKRTEDDDEPECVEKENKGAVMVYRDKKGWRCKRCAPAKQPCENRSRGCRYKDIDRKCLKHELNFCEKSTECRICDSNVLQGRLFAHYKSVHDNLMCRAGSTWRMKLAKRWRHCLLTSAAGTSICWYKLVDTGFEFEVHSPIRSDQLKEFQCSIRVKHPSTGNTRTYTPDTTYDTDYDWGIKVKKEEFPSWSNQFEICVDLNEL